MTRVVCSRHSCSLQHLMVPFSHFLRDAALRNQLVISSSPSPSLSLCSVLFSFLPIFLSAVVSWLFTLCLSFALTTHHKHRQSGQSGRSAGQFIDHETRRTGILTAASASAACPGIPLPSHPSFASSPHSQSISCFVHLFATRTRF